MMMNAREQSTQRTSEEATMRNILENTERQKITMAPYIEINIESWKQRQIRKLDTLKHDLNRCWKHIKGQSSGNSSNITPEDWFSYFKCPIHPGVESSVKEEEIQSQLINHDKWCD